MDVSPFYRNQKACSTDKTNSKASATKRNRLDLKWQKVNILQVGAQDGLRFGQHAG